MGRCMSVPRLTRWLPGLLLALSLAACGGGSSGRSYSIGGTLSGLAASKQLTLLNNGSDSLTLSANGAFTFASKIPRRSSYNVSVGSRPPGQFCSIVNGSGFGVVSNVNNVQVRCVATVSIGGTLSGLTSGQKVTLLDNGGNQLTLTANGNFLFPSTVPAGSSYTISVASQPGGQTCTVAQGTGYGITSNVTSVAVNCAAAHYAYVSNLNAQNVTQYLVGSGGALSPTTQAPVPTGVSPGAVVLDPTGPYAYVPNVASGTISQYDIGSGGALTPMAVSAVSAGHAPGWMAIDPAGNYAYVLDASSASVLQYAIGSSGELSPTVAAPVPAGSTPQSIVVDGAAAAVYVANTGGNSISQYTIGTAGALTPMATATVAAGTSPAAIAVDPAAPYVYVANSGDNTISQYSVGAGGALSALPSGTVATGRNPVAIAVDPSGSYVYVVNVNDNTISGYSIGSSGALTAIGTPIATGTGPQSIAFGPGGTDLYVTNLLSDSLSEYAIGSNGQLSPLGTPGTLSVTTGSGPQGIAVR